MKLTLKRVLKEELARSKESVPKYMEPVLKVLNDALEQIGNALSNRLSFEDNVNCTIVTRDFTSATELEINPLAGKSGNLRVTGALIIAASELTVDKFKWVQKSNGNIGVTVTFDGGGTATCKILALLG